MQSISITVTDEEYREIVESIPYMSDDSYALRIAAIIARNVEVDENEEKGGL